jgi:hypothetical protein
MELQKNVKRFGLVINPNLMKTGTKYSIPFEDTYKVILKTKTGIVEIPKYSFTGTPKCGYDLIVRG